MRQGQSWNSPRPIGPCSKGSPSCPLSRCPAFFGRTAFSARGTYPAVARKSRSTLASSCFKFALFSVSL